MKAYLADARALGRQKPGEHPGRLNSWLSKRFSSTNSGMCIIMAGCGRSCVQRLLGETRLIVQETQR